MSRSKTARVTTLPRCLEMASKTLVVLALMASSLGNPAHDSPTTYQDFESNHIGSPTPSLPQILNSPSPPLQYSTYPTNQPDLPQYSTYPTNPPDTPQYSTYPTNQPDLPQYSTYPTNPPDPPQYSTYPTNPPTTHSKPSDDHEHETQTPPVSNVLRPGTIIFTITAPYPHSPSPRFPFGRSPLGLNAQRFPLMSQRFPFLYRRQGVGARTASSGYVANPATQNIPVAPHLHNPQQFVTPVVLQPIHLDLNKTTPFEYKFECRPNCLRTRSILPLSLNFRFGCYPIRICTRLLLIHSREPIRNANLARAGIRAAGNNGRTLARAG